MSHPQALRIPFQEFGFFTQPCRELSLPTPSHTHILEENLLMTCKSPKNSLPLHPIYNNDNNDLILFPMSKYSLKEKEGTIKSWLKMNKENLQAIEKMPKAERKAF